MKKINLLFIPILWIIVNTLSIAQQSAEDKVQLDSLNQIINESNYDTAVAHAYVAISEILAGANLDTVIILCEKAKAIAKRNLANKDLNIKEKQAFQLILALALNNIGTIHYYQGNLLQTFENYQEAIKIKEEIGDLKSLITSLNNLGAIYIHQGELELALETFHKALVVLDEIDDPAGKAVSLNNIGAVYKQQGKTNLALEKYNEALELRKKIGDKIGISNSLNNLGATYMDFGNVMLALETHHKALEIREEIGDKMGIGNSLNNIGYIYAELNDFKIAFDYYQKALLIREDLGDKNGIALSYNNLGVACRDQGDYQKGLEYFQKALTLYQEVGNNIDVAHTLNNIGFIHKEQGAIPMAMEYFQRAKQIGEEHGNKISYTHSLINLGSSYLRLGNYYKAIEDGKTAFAIAEEAGFVKELEESSELLYQAYKTANQFENALEMHELFLIMRDSLVNEKNTREIAIKELNYQHEKKLQADHLARTEAEHKEELLQQRKDQLTYGSTAFVIIVSFFGFMFMRSHQRKKELISQRKLNDKLKHIDKLKDQFLANTSHELRTPLNGIIGLSESLREGVAGKPTRVMDQNLAMIISSGRRLSGLINDILDFSKLREKDISLSLKPIDLFTTVDVDLRILYPSLIGKQVELINRIPKNLVAVEADESRLQQILINLVGNAIKFTQTGTITVSAVEKDKMVAISVADTGIGISPDKLDTIFDAFDQADASTERKYGGSGLGLNIARQLVGLHKGTLTVESELGKGSVFTFTLPVSNKKAIIPKGSISITRPRMIIGSNGDHIMDPIHKVGTYNILIVDDEPVNRQVIANYLKGETFKVAQAGSGPEALNILEKNKFDLVLLDVMMPGMSGFEVCQKLREKHLSSELPVIMVTAKDQVSDLVQGLNTGANDYLIKPVSRREMLARIKTHLNLLKINNSYSRFVPREFLHSLGKEDILDVHLGDQVEGNITVMFSDIRSYSGLSESMTVKENFKFLNAYLGKIGPVIHKNHGFVNQFLGDGIMALFQQQAEDALKAALEIQEVVDNYNIYRLKKDRKPITIGIGLHYGSLMLGIIGDDKRMDAGVVSDAVNTASRLEGLTKYYGASIVLSQNTVNQIKNLDMYHHRSLGKVLVKGKKEALSVFEFFGGETPCTINLKENTKMDFEKGLEAFYHRQFTEAAVFFNKVIKTNENDLAAQMYLRQSANFMIQGVPDDWAGLNKMLVK